MDARTLLKTELSKRCAKNPQYSLRAFARSLGMSHTVLSLVLSGKRELSKRGIESVTNALGLSPVQKRTLIERKAFGTALHAETDVNAVELMSLDQFNLISEWHHLAILSLLEIPGAEWDATWIGAQLGISEIQAKLSMERLERMGIVGPDEKGRWKQTKAPIRFDNTVSTSATRKYQRQLLEKAIESLEQDPIEERDHGSITLAIDEAQLDFARGRIREFRRELMRELEARGNPNRVYQLTVQLFPTSKRTGAKKAKTTTKQREKEANL